MTTPANQAIYRVHRRYDKNNARKAYQGTYELIDENSQQVLAVCELIGKAVFSTLAITDHQKKTWQMKPNRKIMPSRWVIADSNKNISMQFDQKILGKMINPLYKTALVIEDCKGNEIYRLVDPRTDILDRILGVGPGDWAIMNGDTPLAKLIRLPRQHKPAKGLFGKLKKWLSASDRGILSAGQEHVLPAPAALGLLLLFDELQDSSAG